ncbi:GDSL-type esterase/lipase family protein [Mucilaginibacter terrae]|uniref:Lysophospholipase L1-like esterase n=1 Tax=Mucilaginibacter terrae TaxID=1955052 RepID=A0ABU3GQ48_9SPHI|nr:GDSL-type esterase/lipase family protein [Mucilaginibacter terrae]MDT3401910.1 lysophospholipase L1-like esterase [Mucilaginibacter terrae]
MKLKVFLLLAVSCIATFGFAQQKPFWNEIQAFKKKDSLNAPAKGGILFVGSSSFTKWTELENVYKSYGAINRGFGGSNLVDANYYAKDIVFPYQARQIVIYSGENDIAGGASAIETLNRFATFFTSIRNNQPNVPVIYISMKQSPSRMKFASAVVHANALIKEYLTHYKATQFIDVDSKMHNKDGSLRPELFLPDMLHMKQPGYDIWIKEITPYLIKKIQN